MPLSSRISFKAPLQKNNRIAIPKLMRWQFKIEPDQVLKVCIWLPGSFQGWQFFYAKMSKDGRILIPLITLEIIAQEKKPNLTGHIFEIKLEPA